MPVLPQVLLNKYFWDSRADMSDRFVLTRLLEYAAFPDLLRIPFALVKAHIADIRADRLRTSESRKLFVGYLARVVPLADDWDGALAFFKKPDFWSR